MIKLYNSMKKRLAKKKIGRRWYILQHYANEEIKEGAVIHTCRGYNEVIAKIEEIVSDYSGPFKRLKRGMYVLNLDIETEDGCGCSLAHCCTFPPPSAEEVLQYFKYLAKHDHGEWDFGDQHNRLIEAVKNGENPFDERGCVLPQYKVKRGENNDDDN